MKKFTTVFSLVSVLALSSCKDAETQPQSEVNSTGSTFEEGDNIGSADDVGSYFDVKCKSLEDKLISVGVSPTFAAAPNKDNRWPRLETILFNAENSGEVLTTDFENSKDSAAFFAKQQLPSSASLFGVRIVIKPLDDPAIYAMKPLSDSEVAQTYYILDARKICE